MTQKTIKPGLQRTNTISSLKEELPFQTKKADVLRVKKIDPGERGIKQIYKYSFTYSISQYTLVITPGKKI